MVYTCMECLQSFSKESYRLSHQARDHPEPGQQTAQIQFFTNLGKQKQSVICPLACGHNTKNITTRGIHKHFESVHPDYKLVVDYRCQRCNKSLDLRHIESHSERCEAERDVPCSSPTSDLSCSPLNHSTSTQSPS